MLYLVMICVRGIGQSKGHRAERHDGKGKLNSRLRNNQRKDSQYERPIHPDAQAAYDALVNSEDINRALFPDE